MWATSLNSLLQLGGKELSIVLKEDTEVLDEVVVIGYGTTTKRKLTGSVSSLNAEKLESTPFPNVTQALQGQVPGLIVNSSGGAFGGKCHQYPFVVERRHCL